MARFVDVVNLLHLVDNCGVTHFIEDLAEALREDFVRWHDFDKSARVASHSHVGVIELMPVADKVTTVTADKAYATKDLFGLTANGRHRAVLRRVA